MSDCGNWLILTPLKECRNNLLYFCNLKETGEITGPLKLQLVINNLVCDYDVSKPLQYSRYYVLQVFIYKQGVNIPDG